MEFLRSWPSRLAIRSVSELKDHSISRVNAFSYSEHIDILSYFSSIIMTEIEDYFYYNHD